MHQHYHEILHALGEPLWWDEHGVPRFVEFTPTECGNIYAEQVAIVEIHCQGCNHPFMVCYSSTAMDSALPERLTLAERIEAALAPRDASPGLPIDPMGYGDPPNIDCCLAGPTMAADVIRVAGFWRRTTVGLDWELDPSLAVVFPDA